MKRLSIYVQHLSRYAAQALLLESGSPVVARFPKGDRASNQPIEHSQLVAVIQEAAPSDTLAEIRAGRSARFVYDETGEPVTVDVVPTPGAWKVTITPAGDGHAAASPGAGGGPVEPRARAITSTNQAGAGHGAAPHAAPQPQQRRTPTTPQGPGHAPAYVEGGETQLDRWLTRMTQVGASDLHLSSGNPPMVRLHGEVRPLEEGPALESDALRAMLFATMSDRHREEFDARRDTDWAYEIPGLARFRANAFVDRKGVGGVFRRIPYEILTPEQIGLPRVVLDLCNLTKGLVLVTGPTGSGKSTTLATLIDVINQSRDDHIITIEDPIEFVHENKRCLVNQREVGAHTESFKNALRAALREDPDIVLVGEMRDLETIAIAIETAETGHLVFGTLHTTTAPSTVDRIIDQFPSDRQAQIRTMLSESLKGVIAQVLCKKVGGGRIAAYEILVGTPAVSNLIREGKTFQIPGVMQTSRNVGMQTMNDNLIDLAKRGVIEPREAYLRSVNKSEMRGLMTQAGMQIPSY